MYDTSTQRNPIGCTTGHAKRNTFCCGQISEGKSELIRQGHAMQQNGKHGRSEWSENSRKNQKREEKRTMTARTYMQHWARSREQTAASRAKAMQQQQWFTAHITMTMNARMNHKCHLPIEHNSDSNNEQHSKAHRSEQEVRMKRRGNCHEMTIATGEPRHGTQEN